MRSRPAFAPLLTDSQIVRHVDEVLERANGFRFWLLFLDGDRRPTPTVVPVDGIPDRPDPEDDARLVPMFSFLADTEEADAVVIVLERPGGEELLQDDIRWARCLRAAAAGADLEVRASVLLHDRGTRWIAPDDWM